MYTQTEYILFICTGNFYRSRFAEYYFNFLTTQMGGTQKAFSRGLEVFMARNRKKGALSQEVLAYLKQLEIPLETNQRYPRQLLMADLQKASKVIALDETEHRKMFQRYYPQYVSGVEFWKVHDVDRTTPEEALPAIKLLIDRMFGQ
ncbi:hypothetical protein AAG747_08540 [Rapidithrix thailandica]|uniref:Phosphotyrosine protein phosphatase I domain-containing protein n=1 Tax=Rapidithrix thailandica TaxID=413964 RepID=A0AAW9S6F3_9BACT